MPVALQKRGGNGSGPRPSGLLVLLLCGLAGARGGTVGAAADVMVELPAEA